MAVLIKGKSAEKASKEVDGHLESTTKLLREANCTPLGLNKLADAWDKAQEESFRLAQHQLDTSGTRKRGRGKIGKAVKQTAKHFSFHSRPKGRNRLERTDLWGGYRGNAGEVESPRCLILETEDQDGHFL